MKFENRPYRDLRLESDDFSNPRRRSGLDTDEIRELACHIGRHGLRVPLTITRDGVITAGQRRYLAIGMVLRWRDDLGDLVAVNEATVFDLRAIQLAAAVPCTLEEEIAAADIMAAAIADNLLRSEMSSFDVAEQVMTLADVDGLSLTAIADKIGRSRPYVSKMVSTWRQAGPDLKDAWATDRIAYSVVQELADLPLPSQRAALLAPADRAKPDDDRHKRAAFGRPGVAALKAELRRISRQAGPEPEPEPDPYRRGYRRGLIVALEVATGAAPLGKLAEDDRAAGAAGVHAPGDGHELRRGVVTESLHDHCDVSDTSSTLTV